MLLNNLETSSKFHGGSFLETSHNVRQTLKTPTLITANEAAKKKTVRKESYVIAVAKEPLRNRPDTKLHQESKVDKKTVTSKVNDKLGVPKKT